MNLDTDVNLEKNDKNQENFKKKKKIIVISLSAAIVFITLIAGLFFAKKSKESSHENDGLSEVVDKKNDENQEIIVNRSEYFFEKTLVINIFSFLIIGILFFFWENDKLPKEEGYGICCEISMLNALSFVCCGSENKRNIGVGLSEKSNWFVFATLGALVVIPLLVEPVLNLLIGSISHFLSKDKNKKYFHTLGMSLRKRIQYFSSFSIAKTLFIALGYLTAGIIVAMVARVVRKFHPCCCRPGSEGQIIVDHGPSICCGFGSCVEV